MDPTDKDYNDIYCSFFFLGFKKESPLNKDFIYNLKNLKKYGIIENSPFSKEIENFNYDILDEEFLQDFNIFIDYIFQKPPEEKKINEIIKKLKYKIIIEKIDNNLNNIQAIEHKDNYDVNSNNIQDNISKKKNKDEELNIIHIDSPEKDKDNMHTIQDDNQIQVDMPIPKENSEAILKNIQANNQKENYDNNLNNTQNRSSAKEEVSDNENYKIDKDSMKKVFLKKEKNTKNLTPINSNNEEDSSNKEETEITISKKIGSEIDDDSYEKFIDKNKLKNTK